MAVSYGPKGTLVNAGMINVVATTGGTILSSGGGTNGYEVVFQHDVGGCGVTSPSGIYIELKDTIPWTRMSVQFELLGTASCWGFNVDGGYGTIPGYNSTGNLLAYDESAGDRLIRQFLSQSETQFSTHDKFFACDNDANNFMRYNSDAWRKFTMIRRRNVNGSLGGVHHGRSCNSTGSGSLTKINNICVW